LRRPADRGLAAPAPPHEGRPPVTAPTFCPGSGGPIDETHPGLCPVCSLPVYEPMAASGRYVIERHRPWVASVGKVGVHSPACRQIDGDDCVCAGVAA